MRDRVVDFLPLLLAAALVAAWLGLQQPLSWLRQASPAPASVALAPALATPGPPVPRAIALLGLCDATGPRFLGTLANLKQRLGAPMGEALECERPIDRDGNTEQFTTTGLAYYRRTPNLAVFTTGWEHWALDGQRLVHWAGRDVEPPPTAARLP